mgnify:FL=1
MNTSNPFGFVGGRRRYNAQRQRAAAIRRHTVAAMLANDYQADIARALGVHKSTICRDARAIGAGQMWTAEKCPYCKRWYMNLWGNAAPQCNAIGRPMKRRRQWWAIG